MTARTDLSIPQGTTWAQSWQITGYDLTGTTWTARSQVRRSPGDASVLHEFTAAIADDIVTLTVTPAESTAWTWHSGVYDVEIESAAGVVLRVAQGSVRVDREVTRSE